LAKSPVHPRGHDMDCDRPQRQARVTKIIVTRPPGAPLGSAWSQAGSLLFSVTRGSRPQRGDLRLPLTAVDLLIDQPIAFFSFSWCRLLGPSSCSLRQRSQRPQGQLRAAQRLSRPGDHSPATRMIRSGAADDRLCTYFLQPRSFE